MARWAFGQVGNWPGGQLARWAFGFGGLFLEGIWTEGIFLGGHLVLAGICTVGNLQWAFGRRAIFWWATGTTSGVRVQWRTQKDLCNYSCRSAGYSSQFLSKANYT